MLQKLNVVDDSCESTVCVKEKGGYFANKLWHFSSSITQ